jgi:uracil-DNA glycosylase
MVVGEAPGRLEDARGIPFIGKAGTTLNAALLAAGSRREHVYVTNVVKCRPPRNRTPYSSESDICGINYLDQEIEYLKPKRILALGNASCDYLLGYSGISSIRGEWVTGLHGIHVLPTWHPAALLYDPQKTPDFILDVDEFVNRSHLDDT